MEKTEQAAAKEQQRDVIQRLKEEPTAENLWHAVVAFQHTPFKTSSGLDFQYEIKKGRNGTLTKELWIDRREKSKSLSWSSIRLAFSHALEMEEVVERPKALGDIRGISYIYPILWRCGLIRVPEKIAENMKTEND